MQCLNVYLWPLERADLDLYDVTVHKPAGILELRTLARVDRWQMCSMLGMYITTSICEAWYEG